MVFLFDQCIARRNFLEIWDPGSYDERQKGAKQAGNDGAKTGGTRAVPPREDVEGAAGGREAEGDPGRRRRAARRRAERGPGKAARIEGVEVVEVHCTLWSKYQHCCRSHQQP